MVVKHMKKCLSLCSKRLSHLSGQRKFWKVEHNSTNVLECGGNDTFFNDLRKRSDCNEHMKENMCRKGRLLLISSKINSLATIKPLEYLSLKATTMMKHWNRTSERIYSS